VQEEGLARGKKERDHDSIMYTTFGGFGGRIPAYGFLYLEGKRKEKRRSAILRSLRIL